MTNTYAINTTRGQEFAVEAELKAMGLHPWVARRLTSKRIKEQKERVWFDTAYVPKLMFCAFPAVYWNDVKDIKHIVGNPVPLSRGDIAGRPACQIQRVDGTFKDIAKVWGLTDFRDAVAAEYADAERNKINNLFQCEYVAGQALEILTGPFWGMPAAFKRTIKQAHNDYASLLVEVTIMGGTTQLEVAPDQVGATS